ncbi:MULTISPECIES: helix-turn-helix transcriptional regulator [Epilithonimonas]|uniref:XRE family transcriptional regulator n=1 Tax=Epilithonimonas hominis TaxID=420404 RepID=A0A3N0X976_9FLAO|nr:MULTISPECIES: helix-turn-helix transcriptional regulator [Epilithonimonas]ROI13890.1 XRE family transcriptional regulator [Epilithonimonas hominis]
MKINEKIKQLRALSSYSQAYVAEKLFISQRAYSDIENGKTKIDIDRLKDIAKLFDTSILDILTTSQNQEIYLQKIKHLESEVELLKERLNKEANH